MDVADACHERGVQDGRRHRRLHARPRRGASSTRKMDAANVDLKAFTDDFYVKLTGAHLQPVLDTLAYLKHETDVLVRDHHAADPRQERLRRRDRGDVDWIVARTRPRRAAALHRLPPRLQARSTCRPRPPATLQRARDIARAEGIRYVYTGNVHDTEGGTTYCPGCGTRAHRARLAPHPRLPPHRRRPLRRTAARAIAGRFEHLRRPVRPAPHPGARADGLVARVDPRRNPGPVRPTTAPGCARGATRATRHRRSIGLSPPGGELSPPAAVHRVARRAPACAWYASHPRFHRRFHALHPSARSAARRPSPPPSPSSPPPRRRCRPGVTQGAVDRRHHRVPAGQRAHRAALPRRRRSRRPPSTSPTGSARRTRTTARRAWRTCSSTWCSRARRRAATS